MTLISHKKISQDVKVLVYQYPFASKVNKDLHKLILEKATPGDRNPNTGSVHMTSWRSFDEFKIISQWAKQIVDGFGGNVVPKIPRTAHYSPGDEEICTFRCSVFNYEW